LRVRVRVRMALHNTAHFETGQYQRQFVFLDDAQYSVALDCLVKGCTDMLLVNGRGQILLGKRNVQPQPDWWFGCGGRMRPGETPTQSAMRLLNRELSLNLTEPSRLQTVGHYSFLWAKRSQPPEHHGTADLSIVLTMVLTDEEISKIKSDNKEYSESRWTEPEEILRDPKYHPALKQATRDLLAVQIWHQLKHSVSILETHPDDSSAKEKVVDLARRLVGRVTEVEPSIQVPEPPFPPQ